MNETTTTLTEANFAGTISDNDIVLVDFWAPWCGPCRQFAPTYEKVALEFPDVVFGKVNTEDEQNLAAAGNITSIPTIMAFRQGILVFQQAGALPAPMLRDLITQVKGLDMDAVREKIAAAQADGATNGGGPAQAEDELPAGPDGKVPGVDYPDANGAIV